LKEKIIIFGTGDGGKSYHNNNDSYETIAFCDNDEKKQGELFNDIKIISPNDIKNINYDYIVIASMYVTEIKEQLITELGIESNKIIIPNKKLLKRTFQPFQDKETLNFARKTLIELAELFEEKKINYFINFGVLLGLIRDGDILPWDDDIDLAVYEEDKNVLIEVLKEHFLIVNRTSSIKWNCFLYEANKKYPINLYLIFNNCSINNFPIGIDFLALDFKTFINRNGNMKYPRKFFEDINYINFKEKKIRVPNNPEEYLKLLYGDWQTPKKDISFEEYSFTSSGFSNNYTKTKIF